MIRYFLILIVTILAGCTSGLIGPGTGVSKELADNRFDNISQVRYKLHFSIPDHIDSLVHGNAQINFELKNRETLWLDFLHDSINPVKSIVVNGTEVKPEIVEEHLVLSKRVLKKGKNEVKVAFLAGEQSLNRRADFLYTLLVPDRARTLFPCFDQPDIKAVYELSLDLPEGWVAMSNAPSASREADFIRFAPSDPLPTYLFHLLRVFLTSIQ